MYTYEYQRPALAVDCVVFGFDGARLNVLLIKRAIEPFKGGSALPGGFVRINETVDDCARRELTEETGIDNLFMEQLYTFSDIDRDPRERVVSVAYFALVKSSDFKPASGGDASNVAWVDVKNLTDLAFDHQKIINMALIRIKNQIRYKPIGFELLNDKFSIPQLQLLYEAVLNKTLDRRNFSGKILKTGLLVRLDEKLSNGRHRSAQLYRFDRQKYNDLSAKGFNFEI